VLPPPRRAKAPLRRDGGWRFGSVAQNGQRAILPGAVSRSRWKAVEGYRSPRRFAFAVAAGKSARSWTAPVLWRFGCVAQNGQRAILPWAVSRSRWKAVEGY